MTADLRFDHDQLPPECETLRQEVRAFIAAEVAAGAFDPIHAGHGELCNPAFSRRVGGRTGDPRDDLAPGSTAATSAASSSATS